MDYEEIIEIEQNDPDKYQEYLRKGYFFTAEQQKQFAALDTEQIFNHLLSTKLSWYLHVYPQYATPALRELEQVIIDQFNNTSFVSKEDIAIIRHTLGKKARPYELIHLREYTFTVQPSPLGTLNSSGKIEYLVRETTKVPGPRFLVTSLKSDPFEIAFYLEEIGQIMPQEANAYSMGLEWCWNIPVHNHQAESPIVTNTCLSPLYVPDGDYQVIPIRFYNAIVDTTIKYKINEERDGQGNRVLNIVPREEEKQNIK